jgi:protein required for attachment to host cells
MAELKEGTWVVVADGEKALFLRNLTDHDNPNLSLVAKDEQDNPSNRDQSANRPGRRQGDDGQKSAMEDTDWHELAKERFAADLADHLYREAHRGAFRHLVRAASPQVLGEVRNALHKEVADRVIAEIPKTLTNHPVPEIESLVKKALETA